MKTKLFLFFLLMAGAQVSAAPLDPIPLWPDQPPGALVKLDEEKDITTEASGK